METAMRTFDVDGVSIAYEVQGSGDPLVLIHGSILADGFFPMLTNPRLARDYSLIRYHRRGYASSSRATAPVTISRQAADARALMRHLGVHRAHVAGHSYGAVIAMQWALDAPEEVRSLALLEPPLLDAIPSGAAFDEHIATVRRDTYDRGDNVKAVDAFLTAVVGPHYQRNIDEYLPGGAFDMAVSDIDTFFLIEYPALRQWRFTANDATQLRQPVLSVLGAESAPIFREGHEVLRRWIAHAEELVVARATHGLPYVNPSAVAEGLARFFASARP